MAIGAVGGLIGGLLTRTMGLGAGILKWGLPLVGIGVATEMATNKDGKGGVVSKHLLRDPGKATVAETSALGALDSGFDGISYAQNAVTTFISGTLATWLEAIAHFTGSEKVAGWAQNCRDFAERSQDIHFNRANRMRENGSDGELGKPGTDAVLPVETPNGPTGPEQKASSISNGQYAGYALGAVSALGLTGVAAHKMLGGKNPAAAVTDVTPEGTKLKVTSKPVEYADDVLRNGLKEGAEEAVEAGAKKGMLSRAFSLIPGRYGKALGLVTTLGVGGLTIESALSEANASELPRADDQIVSRAVATPEAVQTPVDATVVEKALPADVDAGLGHRIMVSADAVKDGAGNFVGNTLGLVHWAGNGIGGWFGNDNIMPDAMSGENLSKNINAVTDFAIYDVAGASTKAAISLYNGEGISGAFDAVTTRYKPEILDQTDASLHENISLGTELGLGVASAFATGGLASAGLAGTFANAANAGRFVNAGLKATRFVVGTGTELGTQNVLMGNALRMP